eukprot:464959_1
MKLLCTSLVILLAAIHAQNITSTPTDSPTAITNDAQVQSGVIDDGIYAIHGYYNGSDMKYLSYNTENGWCRQMYDDQTDGRFKFVHIQKDEYYIQNVYPDKRQHTWLSYGKWDERGSGHYVGLWTKPSDRAIWKLTPVQFGNDKLAFNFQCYYEGNYCGYLSYQNDGKWNKLYDQHKDAVIYVLEKHSPTVITDDAIYAIQGVIDDAIYALHDYYNEADMEYLSSYCYLVDIAIGGAIILMAIGAIACVCIYKKRQKGSQQIKQLNEIMVDDEDTYANVSRNELQETLLPPLSQDLDTHTVR